MSFFIQSKVYNKSWKNRKINNLKFKNKLLSIKKQTNKQTNTLLVWFNEFVLENSVNWVSYVSERSRLNNIQDGF